MSLQDIKAQLADQEETSCMQELDTSLLDSVSGGKDWWVEARWTMRF